MSDTTIVTRADGTQAEPTVFSLRSTTSLFITLRDGFLLDGVSTLSAVLT